jgi:hypothetical protein
MNLLSYLSSLIDALSADVSDLAKADKPSKKDVWNQTVAFLAQHGYKKYGQYHAQNKEAERKAKEAENPGSSEPPKPPKDLRPGTMEGEVVKVKGGIVPKKVSFPMHNNKKEVVGHGSRMVNQQATHHFVWKGGKWNHSHTTYSGHGLNSKG